MARKMKDSGIEWIGEIPEDWEIVKAKYLFQQRSTKGNPDSLTLLSPSQKYGVVPQELYEELSGMSAVKLNQETDFAKLKTIKIGDFCISLRSFQGGFEYSNYSGVVSPAYQVFYGLKESFDHYYKHLFKDKGFIDKMNSYTMSLRDGKNISFSDFGNSFIPYPPQKEQKIIANRIGIKTQQIENIRNTINKQIQTLEDYKKSVITEAVTKGLDPNVEMKDSGIEWIGKVPKHWEVKKGKYIFKQRNEKGNSIKLEQLSPTQEYGVIPQSMYEELSGMRAVKLNQSIDLNLLKSIYKEDYCISLRSFQGGFEYSEYNGVVSPAYQVFYKSVPADDFYYKFLFKELGFIGKINSYTMSLRDGKNIAFSDFGKTIIPYPPYEEQKCIGGYLTKFTKKVDEAIETKQKQLEGLEEYKKSLIYEYVTGKKEVHEC